MSRTTLDIDAPILDAVKRIQRRDHRSLGQVVSVLLGEALLAHEEDSAAPATLTWIAKPMRARIDLDDKEALYAALVGPESR